MSQVRVCRPLFALALAAVLPAPIFGAEDGAAEPLTLERVLNEVENVNLGVLWDRESIRQAEAGARATRAALLPQVDAGAYQARYRSGDAHPANDFEASVSGSWLLFDLQQFDTLRAARQATEISRFDYETAVQDVMSSVATIYFEHLRNVAFDEVIAANIEHARGLLDLARNRLEAGVATQIDVTRAEAELVTQEQEQLQQDTVILGSALRLKRLLNLDLGAEIALEPFPVGRDAAAVTTGITLDGVLERRADFRARSLGASRQAVLARAAGRERVPTLEVYAESGWEGDALFSGDKEDDYWTAGMAVAVPVFDGSRIRANQQAARSRLRQEQLTVADLRSSIEAELRIALQDVTSHQAQIVVAEKNKALAEEELRLAHIRYEQGVADNRELIDAENRFTETSFNLVQAVFSYEIARVELARVRGDVRLILSERDR